MRPWARALCSRACCAPCRNAYHLRRFGARNGKSESNTYFFEQQLLWKGLLLEALPSEQVCLCCVPAAAALTPVQKDIATNRPGAAVLDGAVCEVDKRVEFSVASIGGWGGRKETYDGDRKDRLQQTLTVPCFTLDTLLDVFGIDHVSYLAVDTEGSELLALKGFPWGLVTVNVVGVEVLVGTAERKAKETELVEYMASVGMQVLVNHEFAQDTKDVFFVPVNNITANVNHYARYDEAKEMCQRLQRCLS